MKWFPALTEYGTTDLVTEQVFYYAQKLKRDNHMYDDFRTAGQCPSCKAEGLISFLISDIEYFRLEEDGLHQTCCHACAYCKFRGATSRLVVDE